MSLWIHAHTGHAWRLNEADLATHLIGWSAALLITLALSPVLRQFTGANIWAMRTSLTLAVIIIGITALAALFQKETAPQYWIGLALLAGFAAAFTTPRLFDVYVLSAVGLVLDGLITAGIGHAIWSDAVGSLFLIGLVAAGLLAGTVSLILRLVRQHDGVGASA